MIKAHEFLLLSTRELQQFGCDSARLDAELLLMFAWQIENKSTLILKMYDPLPSSIQQQATELIRRRKNREPVAYIMGEKEFFSRTFQLTPAVLIPRPETEHLIESVLERFPDQSGHYRFCDIGTGSGIIATTLACEYPHAQVIATDISNDALQIAEANAVHHQVATQITCHQGDLLSALPDDEAPFHAIISNPPYIAIDVYKKLEPELHFEPRHSLTDEADGLQLLKRLVSTAPKHLFSDGLLIVETGLCGLPDSSVEMQLIHQGKDLAGHLRYGIYQRRKQA
ncbi:MAG: peptide chain release factor N(5)-glutamine methyltransferase [Mariprofundaceae bacterium]